jgi:hypothetical protein
MAKQRYAYPLEDRRQLSVTRMLIRLAMQRRTIYYSDLAVRLGHNVPNMALGKVLGPSLMKVNQWCWERNQPWLSALVVRSSGNHEGLPGEGFFNEMQELGAYTPEVDTHKARRAWAEPYIENVWDYWGPDDTEGLCKHRVHSPR